MTLKTRQIQYGGKIALSALLSEVHVLLVGVRQNFEEQCLLGDALFCHNNPQSRCHQCM
jgi:hypothetical protein